MDKLDLEEIKNDILATRYKDTNSYFFASRDGYDKAYRQQADKTDQLVEALEEARDIIFDSNNLENADRRKAFLERFK